MRAGAQAPRAVSWTLRTIEASTRILRAGCVDLTLTGDQLPQLTSFSSYYRYPFSGHVGVEQGVEWLRPSALRPLIFFFLNYHKLARESAQLRHHRLIGETSTIPRTASRPTAHHDNGSGGAGSAENEIKHT